MSDIATRIKCALGDTGFSQRELAQMIGVTEVTISRYVNGNRVPKVTTLARIADALGVGMGYFFDSVDKDTNVPSKDTISRQAAIDVCDYAIDLWHGQLGEGIVIAVKKKIEELPSAQPEKRTEKRTETHACDCIERQAAIDAVASMLRRKFGIGGDLAEITLAGLPSAQPERIGRWIVTEADEPCFYRCSKCGRLIDERENFCPNCGAKMEEPEDIPIEYFENGGR